MRAQFAGECQPVLARQVDIDQADVDLVADDTFNDAVGVFLRGDVVAFLLDMCSKLSA